MATRPDELVDVLVIGGGPTGLTLACDLQRRGVTCRVVERASVPHPGSRGKGLQPRSLEVLADLGVIDPVLRTGWSRNVRVRWHVGQTSQTELCVAGRDPQPDVPYPNITLLPQWRTEQFLRERLASLGGELTQGCELLQLEQDRHAVTATLRHADGRRQTVHSRYLVGCDGGHSRVREALGLRLRGETRAEHFVVGDVEITGLTPGVAHVWFDAERYLSASPFPGQAAWQVQASVHADAEGRVPRASLELFQRLFRERASRPDVELRDPTWMSDFVSNVRMVDRYRVGQVFLAGDAAHVHSPVGGQGMNMGIQDAYNLGWKLDLVLRGHAGEELLDTYEQERLPVARAVLQGTDVGYSVVFSANPLLTVLRERVLIPLLQVPAVQQAVLGRSHQLDVSYRGSQPAQARNSSARHSGHGSPLSRLRFARGPRAGDRAPDAPLQDPTTGTTRRLFDVTRGPHFTLLLFTGRASSGHAHLQALADRAARRLGDHLRAYFIVPGPDRYGHANLDRSVLVDVDGSAARSYGAVGDVLYLIRPDGHVGVRARCLHEQALETYLDTIWTAQAAGKQPTESTSMDRELVTSDRTAGAGGG